MTPFSLSEDGFESQLAANYIGHFALIGLLLDLLEQTPASRIVSLSSLAHQSGQIHFDDINLQKEYTPGKAYEQTKLACLMFAIEFQRKLSEQGYQTLSVAAHPGISASNLGAHLGGFMSVILGLLAQSSAKGALPTLYAALGEDIIGGDFCGSSGLLEMRGNAKKVEPKAHAEDKEVAKKLWELSESLTGVNYFKSV